MCTPAVEGGRRRREFYPLSETHIRRRPPGELSRPRGGLSWLCRRRGGRSPPWRGARGMGVHSGGGSTAPHAICYVPLPGERACRVTTAAASSRAVRRRGNCL